jgi:two-component system, OmpR family, response regulator
MIQQRHAIQLWEVPITAPMTAPMTILIVDDDAQVRTLLRSRFEKDGFDVAEAKDARELWDQLAHRSVQLITLDLTLGRDDGLALAREIKVKHTVPIIIISAKGDEIDRVVGLELGADDYIIKPFSPREVVARVRAVLRRCEASTPPAPAASIPGPNGAKLSFEGGCLDLSRREVISNTGEPIDLTTAEFNLLELFLRHPQRVMTRDEIMNCLKGQDWSAFDRSVDSAIARLRRKIEPDPDRPRHIKTVRSVGYVFSSDVRRG